MKKNQNDLQRAKKDEWKLKESPTNTMYVTPTVNSMQREGREERVKELRQREKNDLIYLLTSEYRLIYKQNTKLTSEQTITENSLIF